MKKSLYVLLCAAALVSCGQPKQQQKAVADVVTSGNPIFEGWYADPEGIIYGDTYWVFPTWSDAYEKQTYFDCFSSKDLVNWTKHSSVLDTSAVKWAKKAMWAPSIIHKDGKYYFFFGANDVHEGEVGGIGVASRLIMYSAMAYACPISSADCFCIQRAIPEKPSLSR